MPIGAHVSTAGGLHTCVARAQQMGAECMQIFLSAPQRWQEPRHTDEEVEHFQRLPPAAMRAAARQEYLRRYTPEANYAALVHIYERAIAARRKDRFTSTGSQALVNIAS